jgi:hypothetical protein
MPTTPHQREPAAPTQGWLILGTVVLSLLSLGLAISLIFALKQTPKYFWTAWILFAICVILIGFLIVRLRGRMPAKTTKNPITKTAIKKEETAVESFTDRHGRRVELDVTTKVIVKSPPPFTETIGTSNAWDPFSEEEGKVKKNVFSDNTGKVAKDSPLPITQRYQQVLQTVKNLEIGATATLDLTGDSDVALGRFLALIERLRSLARDPRDVGQHAEQGLLLFEGIARQNQAEQVRILHHTLIIGGPENHWLSSVHLPSAIESLEQGMFSLASKRFQTISTLISIILRRKRMIVVRVTDPRLSKPDVVLVHVTAVMALRPSRI